MQTFLKVASDTTIALESLPGREKIKTQNTFMRCFNTDGSEKIQLIVIGNSLKPRSFEKKTGQQLGFDYYANDRVLITISLLFGCLQRFQQYNSKTEGRKAVYLADNCSANGSA